MSAGAQRGLVFHELGVGNWSKTIEELELTGGELLLVEVATSGSLASHAAEGAASLGDGGSRISAGSLRWPRSRRAKGEGYFLDFEEGDWVDAIGPGRAWIAAVVTQVKPGKVRAGMGLAACGIASRCGLTASGRFGCTSRTGQTLPMCGLTRTPLPLHRTARNRGT